ncbi:MAG: response regulator [Candidatus Omnitrophica bacterium]|nr:response regulator [Candidatus Omnitrophota bacterium]
MPKTILVVDDEPVVVEISKRKLEERGYAVLTAFDGNEALECLKTKTPDLIILDVQMPKMNGYTFIMEKSKIPEYVNIPVVVLTAYNELEPLFVRHGVKAYLLKPLKLQALIDKVVEVVGPPALR